MKRIIFVLTAAALTAAMMVAMAAPAMAQSFRFGDFDLDDDDDFGSFRLVDDDDDDFRHHFDGFGGFGRLGVDNEAESGDLEQSFRVTNTGNYASQCVPALQFGNTGNFNNAPSFVQDFSIADDFEPDGIEFAVEPEQAVNCSNTIQQSSAASSK